MKLYSVEQKAVKSERLHQISNKVGDIILEVTVANSDDGDLYVPPAKKHKKNENKNNHNDKEEKSEITELKTSSIILISASPVFEGMLCNDLMEKQQKKIVVHAKSVKDVEDMLFFMSTSELKQDCNA